MPASYSDVQVLIVVHGISILVNRYVTLLYIVKLVIYPICYLYYFLRAYCRRPQWCVLSRIRSALPPKSRIASMEGACALRRLPRSFHPHCAPCPRLHHPRTRETDPTLPLLPLLVSTTFPLRLGPHEIWRPGRHCSPFPSSARKPRARESEGLP
jgi:hypothetical protein